MDFSFSAIVSGESISISGYIPCSLNILIIVGPSTPPPFKARSLVVTNLLRRACNPFLCASSSRKDLIPANLPRTPLALFAMRPLGDKGSKTFSFVLFLKLS